MKLNQLVAFLAVVESKSIRGAARVLGVTQPGVTKAMRDLERDLDVPLLNRSVRGIELTPYGELLDARGKLVVSEIRRIKESLLYLRDRNAGAVSLGTCATAAYRLLPKVIHQFRVESPKMEVNVSEGSLSHFKAGLSTGVLDFVIANLPLGHTDDDFEIMTLANFANVIGARVGFGGPASATLRQLQKFSWIAPGPGRPKGGHELIGSLFGHYQIPLPEHVIQCESLAAALGMMANSDLVGLFTQPLASAEFRRFGLKALRVKESIPGGQIAIIALKGAQRSLQAQRLIDLLHANVGLLSETGLSNDAF